MAAEGGLEAAAFGPSILTHLALPAEQQLMVLSSCRQLLAAIPQDCRDAAWAAHCKWLAAHAWNGGSSLARAASSADRGGCGGDSCAAQLLGEAVKLQALCGPAGSAQLRRMQAAASGLACSLQEQEHAVDPANQAVGHVPCSPAGKVPAGEEAMQPQRSAAVASQQVEAESLAAASGGSNGAQAAPPAAAADSPGAQAVVVMVPAVVASPSAGQAASASADVEPAVASAVEASGPSGLPAPPTSAQISAGGALLPLAAVQADAAADADMLSDSDGDEAGGPTWLDAVFAAQKRVLGGGVAGPAQAKRRALHPPALVVSNRGGTIDPPAAAAPLRGRTPLAAAASMQAEQARKHQQQQQQPAQLMTENDADSADALSLFSS
ncbi:hypothetical protein ABPG75_013356 [Micractinium tetrahymenae]